MFHVRPNVDVDQNSGLNKNMYGLIYIFLSVQYELCLKSLLDMGSILAMPEKRPNIYPI